MQIQPQMLASLVNILVLSEQNDTVMFSGKPIKIQLNYHISHEIKILYYQVLHYKHYQEGSQLFTRVGNGRTRGNDLKLKTRDDLGWILGKLFTKSGEVLEQDAWGGGRFSVSGGV